ncbi:hypothetical protein GCM10020221_00350 [Streptomyces thioluteus]|uniref:Uncharacterized protein n=1 Tax=Streptomyces thioluteus TaxID=66431 RepID=A0ABP6ISP1_STRTU
MEFFPGTTEKDLRTEFRWNPERGLRGGAVGRAYSQPEFPGPDSGDERRPVGVMWAPVNTAADFCDRSVTRGGSEAGGARPAAGCRGRSPGATVAAMVPLPNLPTDPRPTTPTSTWVSTPRARPPGPAGPGLDDRPRAAADTVITLEYVIGRLNLEVADGLVRRCWKG